ncbi:NAD-dependent epimerase/dehydratase family protein [Nocardiopsis sp. YSL2]|uniref:NAD-dependent epimerase/dehydratase family protein n=1 Tax=Nocardiopsis sp. YSL2 TaxID=2939492 RepID=UPI0026F426C3|nr:NAD-dependent epimerase/dehydratase family protein [Nocardiopsis sp. YSL2]
MTHERILVTGGTGMTGRRVSHRLAERGVDVRVGSRSGAPPFEWHDPATWDAVLDGVDGVYLCFHPDLAFPGAAEAVSAFAARAAGRGATRMVLLSGRGEEGARRAEEAVRAAFADLTVLRCAMFAQNFSEYILVDAVRAGTVALPVPDVPEPFVDLADVAEAAARALTEDGHAGRLYEMTGPRSLTFAEAGALMGEAAGHPVSYLTVTPADFVAESVRAGMPAEVAEGLTELFTEILDGRNAEPTDGVERALGRPAGDFADYVARAASEGAWS